MTTAASQPQRYTFEIIEQHNPGVVGHICRYELDRNRSIPLHDHDFYEIECGCKNSAVQTLNGEKQEFRHSDLYLLRPGDVHEVHVESDDRFTFYNIAFNPKYLDFIDENYHLEFVRQWKNEPAWSHRRNFSPQGMTAIRQGLREMLLDTRRRFALDRFLLNFFYLIEQETANRFGNCPVWLQETIQRMHELPWMQMGPRAMEKISGYSLEYISRILQKNNGISPTEVVNDIRMKYAAGELCLGSCDVYQLAALCGFKSPSYFFKLFRRTYGCSPLQYRAAVCHEL